MSKTYLVANDYQLDKKKLLKATPGLSELLRPLDELKEFRGKAIDVRAFEWDRTERVIVKHRMGHRTWYFNSFQEALIWYAFHSAPKRIVKKRGYNRCYWARVPGWYRTLDSKHALGIIRKVLLVFIQENNFKLPPSDRLASLFLLPR